MGLRRIQATTIQSIGNLWESAYTGHALQPGALRIILLAVRVGGRLSMYVCPQNLNEREARGYRRGRAYEKAYIFSAEGGLLKL
jgi:hypothetical protein